MIISHGSAFDRASAVVFGIRDMFEEDFLLQVLGQGTRNRVGYVVLGQRNYFVMEGL